MASLKELGLGASVHFDPPVHTQPYYLEHCPGPWALPVTERLAASIITVPIYPGMSEDDVAYVAQAFNRTAAECR